MSTTAPTKPRLSPQVTSLGAFLPIGESGRSYGPNGITAGDQQRRHQAVEHIFRMATHTGMVGEHRDGDYGVLDCCDEDGDVVVDYGIRTAAAFRFLYRKLGWRMNREDATP